MITTIEDLFRFLRDHAETFEDSDIATTAEIQERLQSEAKSLLMEKGMPVNMLDDKVVFQMHEGWAFNCVKRACVYGPVFTYMEGQELVKSFKNLHDMIDGNEIIP